MTTTPNSIVTTIRIRQGASTALSISYDFTALATLIPNMSMLQSLIDQAITQWWSGLTNSQKSGPLGRGVNLRISGNYLELPRS